MAGDTDLKMRIPKWANSRKNWQQFSTYLIDTFFSSREMNDTLTT